MREASPNVLKFWHDLVYATDAEWVPDPGAGRRLYGLPEDMDDDAVVDVMFKRAKDYDEVKNPRPFLKTVLCRVVSIGLAVWKRGGSEVKLRCLMGNEQWIISTFLQLVGEKQPQLVGFASRNADVPIMLQRGLVTGVQCSVFADRNHCNDYFHKYSGWHVDLCEMLGGYGSSTPKLAEVCAAAGIPGKGGVDGSNVAELWRAGEIDRIRQYQEADALSTLAVHLRAMYMAGKHDTGRFHLEASALERHPEWRSYCLPVEVAA